MQIECDLKWTERVITRDGRCQQHMVQKEPPQLLSSVLAREKAAHRLHAVQGLALRIRTEALLCAGVCSRVFLDSESFGCPCFLNVCVAVVLEKDGGSLLQDSGQGTGQSHGGVKGCR